MTRGGFFYPFPFRAIERHFFAVHCEKILPKKFTESGEDLSEPSDHGIIFANRIGGLSHIYEENDNDRRDDETNNKKEEAGKKAEGGHRLVSKYKVNHAEKF